MRIGIPTWNGRISPVLDTAERLLIVDTVGFRRRQPATDGDGGDQRLCGEEVQLEHSALHLRAAEIADLELDLLICGAVSRTFAELLAGAGVPLRSWIAGDIDEVLRAAASDGLDRPRFRMPGCCGAERRRGRERRREGRGRRREGE